MDYSYFWVSQGLFSKINLSNISQTVVAVVMRPTGLVCWTVKRSLWKSVIWKNVIVIHRTSSLSTQPLCSICSSKTNSYLHTLPNSSTSYIRKTSKLMVTFYHHSLWSIDYRIIVIYNVGNEFHTSVTNIRFLSDRRFYQVTIDSPTSTTHKILFLNVEKRWSDFILINIWNYSFLSSFYSWCQYDIRFYQRLYQNDTCTQWILLKYKYSQVALVKVQFTEV